jgi:hypothetical protein
MTRKHWELLLIGLVPLSLEACAADASDPAPPPSPYDASFASATDLQRQRVLSAATGTEALVAAFVANRISHESACPRSSLGPNGEAVLQGGCTTATGTRIEGTIRREGGLAPSRYTFEHFELHGETELAIDGSISIEKPNEDNAIRHIDLSTTRGGQEVRATIVLRCDRDGCKLDPGAEVSITGVGRATLTLDANASRLTFAGRDQMVADLEGWDCANASVISDSGTRAVGRSCMWDSTAMPVFDPHAKVQGLQLSCSTDDKLHVHAVGTESGLVTVDLQYRNAFSYEYTSSMRLDEATQTYGADWSEDGCEKHFDGLTGYSLSVAEYGTSHGRTELFAVPRVTISW